MDGVTPLALTNGAAPNAAWNQRGMWTQCDFKVGSDCREYSYNLLAAISQDHAAARGGIATVLKIDDASETAWSRFKSRFSRIYSSESEELARRDVFRDNLAHISHQADGVRLSAMTPFADLTPAEFRQRSSRSDSTPEHTREHHTQLPAPSAEDLTTLQRGELETALGWPSLV